MATEGAQPNERSFDPRDLDAWWSRIAIGDRAPSGPLEIFPLVAATNGTPRYRLLAEAIAANEIDVIEKLMGAEVQELTAINKGKEAVLILEGDIVVGAKQNRVVVRSILVPAGGAVPLRVGCVERGRWDRHSSPSSSGDLPADLLLRKLAVKLANLSVRERGVATADQAAIWESVEMKLALLGQRTASSDYHSTIQAYARRPKPEPPAPPLPGQIGALALWRGRLLGIDVLGHPDVWRSGATQRLQSYQFTAELAELDPASAPAGPRRDPGEWLEVMRALRGVGTPSAGQGEDLSLEGEGVVGAGLWHARHPVHLAIFED